MAAGHLERETRSPKLDWSSTVPKPVSLIAFCGNWRENRASDPLCAVLSARVGPCNAPLFDRIVDRSTLLLLTYERQGTSSWRLEEEANSNIIAISGRRCSKRRRPRCNHVAPLGSQPAAVVLLALSAPKHDSPRRFLTFNYVHVLERSTTRFDFGGSGTSLRWWQWPREVIDTAYKSYKLATAVAAGSVFVVVAVVVLVDLCWTLDQVRRRRASLPIDSSRRRPSARSFDVSAWRRNENDALIYGRLRGCRYQIYADCWRWSAQIRNDLKICGWSENSARQKNCGRWVAANQKLTVWLWNVNIICRMYTLIQRCLYLSVSASLLSLIY